jgi:hypothetical protein
MRLDRLHLQGVQPPGLVQQGQRQPDLADVVQRDRVPEIPDPFGRQPHQAADLAGVRRHPVQMRDNGRVVRLAREPQPDRNLDSPVFRFRAHALCS